MKYSLKIKKKLSHLITCISEEILFSVFSSWPHNNDLLQDILHSLKKNKSNTLTHSECADSLFDAIESMTEHPHLLFLNDQKCLL